jgi:hypothetical protein
MKGRVEDGHVRYAAEHRACRLDARHVRLGVEGCQTREALDLGEHRVVDHDRLREPVTAVDYTVPDDRYSFGGTWSTSSSAA